MRGVGEREKKEEGGQRNQEGIGKVRGVSERTEDREKKKQGSKGCERKDGREGEEEAGRYREGKAGVGERGWKIGRRRSRKV